MNTSQFERMVRRHGQDVYAFIAYRTGDPHEAEDVFADTLERAFRARDRFDRRQASAKTWLCAIALNRMRDLGRRRASEQNALARVAQEAAPREQLIRATPGVVERRSLVDAVHTLDPPVAEAIALVYGADLTARQAAELLDVPTTTVQGRIQRGLKALRESVDR